MKKMIPFLAFSLFFTGCHMRHHRFADDITPGHYRNKEHLDWRYGAGDLKIQTTNILTRLMNNWSQRTRNHSCLRPRIIITQIDNRTDAYVPLDMIRDVFEGAAASDGRFHIVVGDAKDEKELDKLLHKSASSCKYSDETRLYPGEVEAPQFLAKVRLTKASSQDCFYTYEDWRMQVTLYDIRTQEVIDTAWDVFQKRVRR